MRRELVPVLLGTARSTFNRADDCYDGIASTPAESVFTLYVMAMGLGDRVATS